MSLINKVKQTIKQYNLIDKSDKIVMGVSGGPDSLALLYVLRAIRKELGITLHIAHLNHMLRGRESARDADFVLKLADKLSIPATVKEMDVLRLSKAGSPEEKARKARFDFLFEVAAKFKADKIALGHNLDDQAETVLMRILRGSGLLGLSGISPKRKIGNFTIIRPLIEIPRKEIDRYLRTKNIKPRLDLTNLKEIYFRNRIRRRLLPELRRYNPNIKQVLANMAENTALDYDYLLKESQKAFGRVRTGNPDQNYRATGKEKEVLNGVKIKLSLAKFLKLHPAMQNMVLRLAYEQLKTDTRRLCYQHIKELKDLISNRPEGAIADLPSSISVIKNPQYLSFERKGAR